MKYRSRVTEVEAMQWALSDWRNADNGTDPAKIVAWVENYGGEARHHPVIESAGSSVDDSCITVRTIDGWATAAPGDYIVMGEATFDANLGTPLRSVRILCDFYPVDAETFERQWEAVANA